MGSEVAGLLPDIDGERTPMHAGEAVVVTLYRLLRGMGLYHQGNDIVLRLVHECLHAVQHGINPETQMLELHLLADDCCCNHQRVRISTHTLTTYKAFIQLMRRLQLGKLVIQRAVTLNELLLFAEMVVTLEDGMAENADLLTDKLINLGITHIRVADLATGEREAGTTSDGTRRRTKDVYFSTISVVKEAMTRAASGHELETRKIKRLILSLVNLVSQEEASLLELANIKSFDDYTFSHSVNVAIYALALGQRLGLPKLHLYHLGICGLFHDRGKLHIPLAVLNKPGKLDAAEWEIIRTHPARGAELALTGAWGDLTARVMTTSFEHHIKYDGSGYPQQMRPRMPGLFSRIITIADCYDALNRPRVYRKEPYVSEKILGIMLAQSGKDFDPKLVKLLINMVGVYPLGALVLLDDNRIGVVTRISESPDLIDRPQVCLLTRRAGGYDRGDTIDLTALDPRTGTFRWSIQETLDPNDYGFSLEEFYV